MGFRLRRWLVGYSRGAWLRLADALDSEGARMERHRRRMARLAHDERLRLARTWRAPVMVGPAGRLARKITRPSGEGLKLVKGGTA